MAETMYDAIVVGARCAGSPVAMLLARKGYRVLVVDRATFPSDTVSTHLMHPPGVAALQRWGLLDQVVATGCPPIDTYAFDFGAFTITGSPGTADNPVAYAPRRMVLDKILVEAASDAGAEVREGFAVTDLLIEESRVTGIIGYAVKGKGKRDSPVIDRARVVVGADGIHSIVARKVAAERYHEKPKLLAGYYTYWSGLPMEGRFETYIRPFRGMAAWPTNDDLTLLIAGWPFAEFESNKNDIEGNYMKTVGMVPAFARRLRGARRVARFGGAAVPNYFRQPFGPGWVLAGDAGYNKDFITAFGMTDAFRDAELCAGALDDAFSGRRSFEEAMREYQASRDAQAFPMYEFTTMLATLEPLPPELQRFLAAVPGNQQAMDEFVRVNAGVTSPAEFFSEENMRGVLAAARSE